MESFGKAIGNGECTVLRHLTPWGLIPTVFLATISLVAKSLPSVTQLVQHLVQVLPPLKWTFLLPIFAPTFSLKLCG